MKDEEKKEFFPFPFFTSFFLSEKKFFFSVLRSNSHTVSSASRENFARGKIDWVREFFFLQTFRFSSLFPVLTAASTACLGVAFFLIQATLTEDTLSYAEMSWYLHRRHAKGRYALLVACSTVPRLNNESSVLCYILSSQSGSSLDKFSLD